MSMFNRFFRGAPMNGAAAPRPRGFGFVPGGRELDEEDDDAVFDDDAPVRLSQAERAANGPIVAHGVKRLLQFASESGAPKWLKRVSVERLKIALQSNLSHGLWDVLQSTPLFSAVVLVLGCVEEDPVPGVGPATDGQVAVNEANNEQRKEA